MQEVFSKIIEELEENQTIVFNLGGGKPKQSIDLERAIQIVKQEAEQYKDLDMEFSKKCVELAEKMNVCDLVAENCRLSNENRFLKLKEFNNGWIPCSERLPEVPEGTEDDDCPEFNVTIKGASRAATLRCSSDGTWFDEFGHVYPVIAWQPLPAPYQPKGE